MGRKVPMQTMSKFKVAKTSMNDESTKATITGFRNHSNRIPRSSKNYEKPQASHNSSKNQNNKKRILITRRQKARPIISMLRKDKSNETPTSFLHCSCSDIDSNPQTRNSFESGKTTKKQNLSTTEHHQKITSQKLHKIQNHSKRFHDLICSHEQGTPITTSLYKMKRNLFKTSLKKPHAFMKTHQDISRAKTRGNPKGNFREKFTIKDLKD